MSAAKPTHAEIYAKLDKLLLIVGEEHEDGRSGTGLVGRVIRTEAKVLAYDRMRERMLGAVSASAVFLGIIWFLVKAKIAAFFGTTP